MDDPVEDHKGDHEQDFHGTQKGQRPGCISFRQPGNGHIRIDQKGGQQQALGDLDRAACRALPEGKSHIGQQGKEHQYARIHIF